MDVKAASNDGGCICEQVWEEQCHKKAYITNDVIKWDLSLSLYIYIWN